MQYAKVYAAAGVPLTYVGPENEATFSVGQDSMIMSPAQTANFMEVLGTTLAGSGLSTRAECCASVGWDYAQQYAAAIEADKAADAATALFTSHGYFVAPTHGSKAGPNRSGRPNGPRSASRPGTRPGTTARRRRGSLGHRTSTPA